MPNLFNVCKICIIDNCWKCEVNSKVPSHFYCKHFKLDKTYEDYDGYTQLCFCCSKIKTCQYIDKYWDSILFAMHEHFSDSWYEEKLEYMVRVRGREY